MPISRLTDDQNVMLVTMELSSAVKKNGMTLSGEWIEL